MLLNATALPLHFSIPPPDALPPKAFDNSPYPLIGQ
jgi:hypothetical protein